MKKYYIVGDSHVRSFSKNSNFFPVFIGQGKEHNFTSDDSLLRVTAKTKGMIGKLIPNDSTIILFFGEPDTRYYLNTGWYPWDNLHNCSLDGYKEKINESINRYCKFIAELRTVFNGKIFVLNVIPSIRQIQNTVVDCFNSEMISALNRSNLAEFIDINNHIYSSDSHESILPLYYGDHVHLNNKIQILLEEFLNSKGFNIRSGFDENYNWNNEIIQAGYVFNEKFGCYMETKIMKWKEFSGKKSLEGNILDSLKSDGIVVVNDYLNSEEIAGLILEFNKIINASNVPGIENIDYSEGIGKILRKSKLDWSNFPVTNSVFFNKTFQTISDRYLNKPANLNNDIFVVKDVVGSKHHANDLHFDVAPTFKFFIYLNDTTAENGAFACIPGSHLQAAEIRKKYGSDISYENRYLSRELPYSEKEALPVEGKAGTLIIFDTDVFHRAGTVSKGERLVMRGHTRPLNEKIESKPSIFTKIKKLFS